MCIYIKAGCRCDAYDGMRTASKPLRGPQSHVRETLAAINVIVDRTNCIYGVREALGRADYEAAAAFIGKFLEIQEQHGPLGPSDGAQAAEQAQVRVRLYPGLQTVVCF